MVGVTLTDSTDSDSTDSSNSSSVTLKKGMKNVYALNESMTDIYHCYVLLKYHDFSYSVSSYFTMIVMPYSTFPLSDLYITLENSS